MRLNQELANQLSSFLSGDLPLSAYRQAMMRFRLEKLESLADRDKNFVYEFETRYAQLKAEAITENQFRQLLGYAAANQSETAQPVAVWLELDALDEKKPPHSIVSPFAEQTSTHHTLVYV